MASAAVATAIDRTILIAAASRHRSNQPGGSCHAHRLTVNGVNATARLYGTAIARDFPTLLPVTITVDDLGGWQKAGTLPRSLTDGNGQSSYRAGQLGTSVD